MKNQWVVIHTWSSYGIPRKDVLYCLMRSVHTRELNGGISSRNTFLRVQIHTRHKSRWNRIWESDCRVLQCKYSDKTEIKIPSGENVGAGCRWRNCHIHRCPLHQLLEERTLIAWKKFTSDCCPGFHGNCSGFSRFIYTKTKRVWKGEGEGKRKVDLSRYTCIFISSRSLCSFTMRVVKYR